MLKSEIVIGATVFTKDGQQLGTVKRVEAGAMLLDAPRQFDYWLEVTIVASSSEGRVDLAIENAELGGYKMDRPNDHNGFREGPAPELDPTRLRL